jgi:predicted transcriptional regulator|tara:strand:+ start:1913 stop:2314 length:402 start_codon:yes stop_codon:yes gene_type:complete
VIWKLLPILLLSGCGLIGREPYIPETKPVEVVTVIKPAAVYHPALPNAISTLPVEWKVLTPQTMQEYLDDLEEGNAPTNAYYGLSTKGYENLSTNMAEVKRYIRQVLTIVQYYKNLDEELDDESDQRRGDIPD